MKNTTFIDGVSQVHFIGGLIRLDTFVLQGQQDAAPAPETTGQLLMTPEGFLSVLGAMEHLAEKLAEAGVLQKNPPKA